jgi:aminoglycoside 2'-N-acetyltransferase I
MAAGDLDLGLFTCDRPLQGFYERAGWHLLPGAVLVGGTRRSPFPSDQPGFDKVTMADCFSAEAHAISAPSTMPASSCTQATSTSSGDSRDG